MVWIYADESCLGNGREGSNPGGAAGLVSCWMGGRWERRDYWVSEPATTNNRMAIRSATEPLAALRQPCRVVFISDSQYLVKGMSEWIAGWIRRGWKRATGPVENADLWRTLVEVSARHEVEWRWIRGHAGHVENEYANWRAIRAAREQTSSGGLVESGFTEWLAQERGKGRYVDYLEFAAPGDERFSPARRPG